VVVIDDGSVDGTGEILTDEFPEVHVLKGNGHLWWAGATNEGIRYVLEGGNQKSSVLLLNNDTLVRSDFLSTLVESGSSNPQSIVGSVVVSNRDRRTILDGGVRINWKTAKYTRLSFGKDYQEIEEEAGRYRSVDFLTGRGTLVPVSVFQTIGMFDSMQLPQYGSDYEFFTRARRAGHQLLVDTRSIVFNTGESVRLGRMHEVITGLSSIRSPYGLRSRLKFARLCCPRYLLPTFVAFDLARLLFTSVRNRLACGG